MRRRCRWLRGQARRVDLALGVRPRVRGIPQLDTELSIAANFSDFGTDLSGLRRRLRDITVRTYDSFPDYGKDFRRLGRWVCNADGLNWRESPVGAFEDA